MLSIERVNDTITIVVGGRPVWQGSLSEWSRALATTSVRTLVAG